jgi:hypothetical protein
MSASNPSDHDDSKQDPMERFRKLLEETHLFPTNYIHKFIGKNSDVFHAAVASFEAKFVGLSRTNERKSANDAHVALTYTFVAGKAEDIIELAQATYEIEDLIYIL